MVICAKKLQRLGNISIFFFRKWFLYFKELLKSQKCCSESLISQLREINKIEMGKIIDLLIHTVDHTYHENIYIKFLLIVKSHIHFQ
jgi:hypothetical protein